MLVSNWSLPVVSPNQLTKPLLDPEEWLPTVEEAVRGVREPGPDADVGEPQLIVIHRMRPRVGLCAMDDWHTIGLTDGEFLTLVMQCGCGSFVAHCLLGPHLEHYCSERTADV